MESENRLPELQELGPVLQQLFKEAKDTATFIDNDVPMVFVDDDDWMTSRNHRHEIRLSMHS